MSDLDPVELTAALLRIPSVAPDSGDAIALLETMLGARGWACVRADRGGIPNLIARWGTAEPVFAFNGHVDVVPTGEGWSVGPYDATRQGGRMIGRGAVDMKSGVASFVAAADRFVQAQAFDGSVMLLITGDEEADAIDGTTAILDHLNAEGVTLAACVVGEPTSVETFGDMMKIGRRGSITAHFTARGTQGHAAYPHRSHNPLPPLVGLLNRLATTRLDEGTTHFDPSTIALTTVDVGNPATNVTPKEARATVNIRFNDAHSGASVQAWLQQAAADAASDGVTIEMTAKISGESFLTPPGQLSDIVAAAVEAEAARRPDFSTGGGTSDARFIQAACPVVEFGLVGKSMHQTDEYVELAEIPQLERVFHGVLQRFFDAQSFKSS